MNEEYLTVKEFAAAAGVSVQTVYKQLNGRLKPYCQLINNRKKIDKSALEAFYNVTDTTEDTKVDNSVDNSVNNLLKEIENLWEQLREKDEQINKLTQIIAADRQQRLLEIRQQDPEGQQEIVIDQDRQQATTKKGKKKKKDKGKLL